MPGFLMFEEYGMDDDGMMADLAKMALRRLPMAWVAHSVKGEYNVDIDPVALLRGDGTDLLNFGEAYTAWIAVRSISQTIEGNARRDRDDLNRQLGRSGGNGEGQAVGKRTAVTDMKRERDDFGQLKVTIEVDASLTQLINSALGEEGGKKFANAEVHMCTTAQIDLSALTSSNNPAAGLIKTLAAAMLFNIIPYLTIVMKDVTIESIDFDLEGDQTDPPKASLELRFQKVKWVYHIINQSNMSLINTTAEYDYTKREKPDSGLSLGGGLVVNPFG